MIFEKKIYHAINSFSKSKNSLYILFIFSFIESIFFPIPPDLLLIPLVLLRRSLFLKYAFYCTLGSVLGGGVGYVIGNTLWWNGDQYSLFANYLMVNIPFFSEDLFLKFQNIFEQHGFIIIFTAGFTPIPYKIFSISAGANDISFGLFVIASILSRGGRFFIISYLLYFYGAKMKKIIENYFNRITLIFLIFIIFIYTIIQLL